jgi:hypothetical protein
MQQSQLTIITTTCLCDPFSRALHRYGRWDAEEGHEDPFRACIYLVPIEFTAQTHWDAHSGFFLLIGDHFRFRWEQAPTVNYPGLLTSRHLWISKGGSKYYS